MKTGIRTGIAVGAHILPASGQCKPRLTTIKRVPESDVLTALGRIQQVSDFLDERGLSCDLGYDSHRSAVLVTAETGRDATQISSELRIAFNEPYPVARLLVYVCGESVPWDSSDAW